MKQKAFERLVSSVKQAGRIRQGRVRAKHVIEFDPADVKVVLQL